MQKLRSTFLKKNKYFFFDIMYCCKNFILSVIITLLTIINMIYNVALLKSLVYSTSPKLNLANAIKFCQDQFLMC